VYGGRVLTTVTAGALTIRGISVGGVYTSLAVPELGLGLDMGMALRSFSGIDTLLLSHAHADHAGALPAFLGLRALHGRTSPLRVVLPAEIVEPLTAALSAMTELQRWPLQINAVPMVDGQQISLRGDLEVRAWKTFHPVPSLCYLVVRRVSKLRPELHGIDGQEIARRRKAGEDVLIVEDRPQLAYVTDTLVNVLDHHPELLRAPVLISECTFLDEKKSLESARAGCHIHLDEIIERAELFQNEHIVLMHFSQLYTPREVREILDRRLPPILRGRVIPFAPESGHWPG
jgi:ribonuclease Z